MELRISTYQTGFFFPKTADFSKCMHAKSVLNSTHKKILPVLYTNIAKNSAMGCKFSTIFQLLRQNCRNRKLNIEKSSFVRLVRTAEKGRQEKDFSSSSSSSSSPPSFSVLLFPVNLLCPMFRHGNTRSLTTEMTFSFFPFLRFIVIFFFF